MAPRSGPSQGGRPRVGRLRDRRIATTTLLLWALLLWALPLGAAPTSAVEPAWTRVAVPDSALWLELPGAVQARHAEKRTPIGRVVSNTLVVKPWGGWIAATVTHAPALALRLAGRGGVLRQARASVLEDTKGTQRSWEPVRRGAADGMRLTFSLRGDDGADLQGVSEVFTTDGLVITVTTALPPGRGAEEARIHGSVRVPGG